MRIPKQLVKTPPSEGADLQRELLDRPKEPLPERRCQFCRALFRPTGKAERFCVDCRRQRIGIRDEWKELPRRKCRACGKSFQPIRPEQKFCRTKCRSEFNHHGGAYLKLRDQFTGMLAPIIKRIEALESRRR